MLKHAVRGQDDGGIKLLTWFLNLRGGRPMLCCDDGENTCEVITINESGTFERLIDVPDTVGLKLDKVGRIVEEEPF